MIETGLNDITIARIRREALKLEKAGLTVDAKQVLGMLAVFQGDADEVDRMFRSAETASGQLPVVVLNHAVALSNVHRHRSAVEVADRAVARAPDDAGILCEAARVYLDAFNVEGAQTVSKRLGSLGKDAGLGQKMEIELARKKALLAKSDVTWDAIAERIELAIDALVARGFYDITTPVNETEVDDALLYEFSVKGGAEAASAAEDAIHSAIAAQSYSPADNAIVFSCIAA